MEKKRKQKLLEEEEEKERAQLVPVSTPIPLPMLAAPVGKPSACAHDHIHLQVAHPICSPIPHSTPTLYDNHNDEPIHSVHEAPGRRAFPPDHPAANWPAHLQDYIYGPISHSPSPPPRWSDDVPHPHMIHTIHAAHSTPTPRDSSALRSELAHPWHTIRRSNHRLLPQRREQCPFPNRSPKEFMILSRCSLCH
ncbi:hypothetical protein B0H10DRAFT_2249691 [Mycena sp. CBHHK59/15]|nr:hypothetical protein B0H10DRAFT_2249691 [Mycena sp. CBHHK59/15]